LKNGAGSEKRGKNKSLTRIDTEKAPVKAGEE
jgi:hypothetical protein